MFSTGVSVLLALTGVALLMHRVGMWATWRFLNRPLPGGGGDDIELPPLTLLKPIKGLEEDLEQNLRSFYSQFYPSPLQVVFATTERDDPALAVARKVAADYPEVETRFVLSRDGFGYNPKVSNLHGALEAARHDLVLQSDANVRVRPGYLETSVREFCIRHADLMGSLVVGEGERSTAAALENLQLTAFTAPGLCMAKELANITCVLGKAMFFRKSDLERLGGLAIVKDVLAEDYMLAREYEKAGLNVVLSTRTVRNINAHTPLTGFGARHSRWLKMRAVVSFPGFVADLGANPLPFALAAYIVGGLDARLLCVLIAVWLHKARWDRALLQRLRGNDMGLAQLWLSPLRDLSLAAIWLYAAFSRTTEWRGRRFRLARGSRLWPLGGDAPERTELLTPKASGTPREPV